MRDSVLESAWLFVGTVAFVWTLTTVAIAVYADSADDTGDSLATLAGAIGTVSWGVWTFGTLDVRVVSEGVTMSFTMPAVTVLGIAFALIPFYIFLTGPIDMIRGVRSPSVDEI